MEEADISIGSIMGIIQKIREDIRALRNNRFKSPLTILAAAILRKLPQLLRR